MPALCHTKPWAPHTLPFWTQEPGLWEQKLLSLGGEKTLCCSTVKSQLIPKHCWPEGQTAKCKKPLPQWSDAKSFTTMTQLMIPTVGTDDTLQSNCPTSQRASRLCKPPAHKRRAKNLHQVSPKTHLKRTKESRNYPNPGIHGKGLQSERGNKRKKRERDRELMCIFVCQADRRSWSRCLKTLLGHLNSQDLCDNLHRRFWRALTSWGFFLLVKDTTSLSLQTYIFAAKWKGKLREKKRKLKLKGNSVYPNPSPHQ